MNAWRLLVLKLKLNYLGLLPHDAGHFLSSLFKCLKPKSVPMLKSSRLLFVYCALSILLGRVSSLCYYPNGDLARDDQACDSTKSTSSCCGQGYACLSNGLCSKTSFTKDNIGDKYGRGSCTDRKWGSGCPNYCVDPKIDIMDGGTGLAVCPTAANKFYCMNSQNTTVNCASGKGVYTLGMLSARCAYTQVHMLTIERTCI